MRNFFTLWRRELVACFLSPIGYITMVVFLGVSGGTPPVFVEWEVDGALGDSGTIGQENVQRPDSVRAITRSAVSASSSLPSAAEATTSRLRWAGNGRGGRRPRAGRRRRCGWPARRTA